MKIGILSKNYAAKRLFFNKIEEAQYKDVRFLNWNVWRNLPLFLCRKLHLLSLSPEEFVAKAFYRFRAMIPTGCDVLHFFNCINFSCNTKWVISVESAVPWTMDVTCIVESERPDFVSLKANKYICKCIETLAKDNCLALLPLSTCSYNIQMELLKQFPQYYEKIKNKTLTLHPAQPLLVNSVEEKKLCYSEDEMFTFIYVGNNYFRKGGRESVEVLVELHKRYRFRLILISRLAVDEQKYLRTNHDEADARQLIDENKDWIEFHEGLPNALISYL